MRGVGLSELGALVLIAPWFLYQHWLLGDVFWQEIFTANIYDRFRGVLFPGHSPWGYYLDELLMPPYRG